MNTKDKTLVLCPLKNAHVYKYVCLEKCDLYRRDKCNVHKEKES